MTTRGQRIKEERDRFGWSQVDLARKAGVSKTLVSALETDPNRATTRLSQIARALKVTTEYLESGKGPKHPAPLPADTYIHATSLEDLAHQLRVDKGPEEISRLLLLILKESQPSDE